MRFDRKIRICVAALAGLGFANATYAQKVCQHFGQWTRVDGRFVCAGDYEVTHCLWTDDCRVNAD